MTFQSIAVIVLFLAALFYVGRKIYRSVAAKDKACGENCKCGVDFSNLPEPRK